MPFEWSKLCDTLFPYLHYYAECTWVIFDIWFSGERGEEAERMIGGLADMPSAAWPVWIKMSIARLASKPFSPALNIS